MRTSGFEIPTLVEESYDIKITIPDDLKLIDGTKRTDLKNKAGSFHFEATRNGKIISVKKSIKLEKRIIAPSEYADLMALMDCWNSEKFRKVIFSE